MAIKLVDELKAMGNFPIAHAEGINLVKTDGTEDNLQNLFDNGELGGGGGGDSSVTLTQQEYEALSEEQKLDGLYYTYDTKRIYKNGVQYGASDAEGIGYNNAESGIQATTVQGAIDKVVKTVEDAYAKKTEIPTTLPANGVQISDNETVENKTWSSSKIASEIPTTLPANGGNADTVNNHTVKSDVPENAVFTDTIYDDTELNAKLNGKADKNAVLNSLEIVNGYTTAQIIPWSDGTHYRGFEDKSSNTYTDIVTKDGVASVAKIENGVMTKLAEVATMDKLNFVPTTRLESGFKVVAYSDRTITGNSKLECLENWVTNALSKYGNNLVIIGNIYNINYVDGFAIVNVWGDNTKGILGASGILVDQDGVYYYKTQNGVPGSGTLTKII